MPPMELVLLPAIFPVLLLYAIPVLLSDVFPVVLLVLLPVLISNYKI